MLFIVSFGVKEIKQNRPVVSLQSVNVVVPFVI